MPPANRSKVNATEKDGKTDQDFYVEKAGEQMYEESNVDQTSNKDRITIYSNQNFDFGGAMSTGGIPNKVQQESPGIGAIKTGPTVSQLQGMA